MKSFRQAALGAGLVVMMVLCAPAKFAAAQVLQQVPGDALVVIKVKNLTDVSAKFSKWSESVGLAAVAPAAADPLASLKQELKIEKGLNEEGDLAFVFLDPAVAEGNPEQSVLVLLPVADYKAFLGNFEGAKAAGAVTQIQPEGAPTPYFVANWGKYAAVSPSQAVVAKKPTGLKLGGLAAKEAEAKDAIVYANLPALRTKLLPQLKESRGELLADIDREVGNEAAAAPYRPVIKAAVGQALNMAEQFLTDATAATVGLSINDQGISTTVMAEFSEGSYLGKLAAETKNTDAPLTAGLPARKYFAFGGGVADPELSARVFGDLIDPIAKELAATKNGKAFADALSALKQGAGATQSFAFGYAQPTGNLGEDSVLQAVTVVKGDAKTIHKSQTTFLKGYAAMLGAMPGDAGAKASIQLTPGTKTVGGAKLDQFKMDLQVGDEAQAEQMKMVMGVIYGPNGMGGTLGAVDEETFVMVQGGNDKFLADAVASAKADANPFAKLAGLKVVDANLPKQRVLVEYIAVDNILGTAAQAMQAFGGGPKLKVPANLPPIGISVATEGTALRVDGFVPTQTIQSIVAAGMQAMMEQGGGDGAAGPDGL